MSFIEYMEEEKMNREVAVKTLIGKGRQYLVKEVFYGTRKRCLNCL